MRLIVIGGGAAGFFCAVTAARMNPKLEVVLLEKTGKLLSKVRISGGGRCNVTHACLSIPEMIKNYPRGGNFLKKAFHQFFTTDTIAWFSQRGVLLKTEPDGRMFPTTDRSESVIRCLLDEASRWGVQIRMNKEVKAIRSENLKGRVGWRVQFADGSAEYAEFLCVACGGYPKSTMFDWLVSTGHSIQAPAPSLFTFNLPGHSLRSLMGVSAVAKLRLP